MRLISFAVAKSLSPNFAGIIKVTLACWARLATFRLLHAKAKALSESVNITHPWQMPCPFMCCCLIFKDKVAVPSFTCSKHMPIDRQVSSSSNIFEATFSAVSLEFIGSVPCFAVWYSLASALYVLVPNYSDLTNWLTVKARCMRFCFNNLPFTGDSWVMGTGNFASSFPVRSSANTLPNIVPVVMPRPLYPIGV